MHSRVSIIYKNHELFYHGRYDKSRPNNGIKAGEDEKGVDMLNDDSGTKFYNIQVWVVI